MHCAKPSYSIRFALEGSFLLLNQFRAGQNNYKSLNRRKYVQKLKVPRNNVIFSPLGFKSLTTIIYTSCSYSVPFSL